MVPSRAPPSPAPPFKPKPLGRHTLAVEVTAGMRLLAPADREAVVARKRAFLARFDVLAPRRWSRVKRFVVGGAVFFPLVNMLVAPIGFAGYPQQVLVGAAYGFVLGAWRLPPVLCGLATIAAGAVTIAWALGGNLFSFRLGCLMAMALYYLVGHALAAGDELTRDEVD